MSPAHALGTGRGFAAGRPAGEVLQIPRFHGEVRP